MTTWAAFLRPPRRAPQPPMQFAAAIRRQERAIGHALDVGGMDSEDESALMAARQALRWVLGEDPQAPLDFNLPPVVVPPIAFPPAVFGPLLIECADFCDTEVVGEVG